MTLLFLVKFKYLKGIYFLLKKEGDLSMSNIILIAVAILAGISGIAGIYVLESFFRNKLKDLFDDKNYFMFFFLVLGYTLYAIGELVFYLVNYFFEEGTGVIGIQDIYWSFGGIFIVISFFALLMYKSKQEGTGFNILISFLTAVGLMAISGFIVFRMDNYLFSYFYPLISSLIVALSFGLILFGKSLGDIGSSLRLFFFASLAILIADLMFSQVTALSNGTFDLLSNIFYLIGYGLSLAAFITFKVKLHSLSNGTVNKKE